MPRLIIVKRVSERGNLIFMITGNTLGVRFLTVSATSMGINIMMERVFIILEKDSSTVCPKSTLINVGNVKGIKREVITTITMTRGLFPFTRFDMNGATTPVEIPDRSSAATA
jgi:hypothetical protein